MPTNPVKRHFTFTIKDSYNEYKSQKEEKAYHTTYKVYQDILREIFLFIIKRVIYERWTFYFPYKMGCLTLISIDQDKEGNYHPVNRAESKKRNKKIVYFNFHSHKRVYQLKWITNFVQFKNKKYYKYRATKGTMSNKYKSGNAGISDMVHTAAKDPTKKLIK